ncbi:MAG: porphobilinogen synthase [Planctomycetota bacterium]
MTEPLELLQRPRRLRRTAGLRRLVRETRLTADRLVLPVFVHDGAEDEPIDALPGQVRHGLDGLVAKAGEALALGVPGVALFPKVDAGLKSRGAEEAWNDNGLIPRAVARLKRELPELVVITDVALDPYNADGHDGLVTDAGEVDNDATVAALCKQAVCQARAGADVVAPSDMMDGRVAALREALDDAGFTGVAIGSYAVKYASAFYGPFRAALDSAPVASPAQAGRVIPGDKRTYQMDPANAREALREVELDLDDGADWVMVKPAGPYLDVIHRVAEISDRPVAAYHVSGEYAMLKAAAAAGALDERAAVLEQLTGIARAGADVIFTYYALDAARWLAEGAS